FAITGTNDNPTVTAGAHSVQRLETGVRRAWRADASTSVTKADPDTGDAAVYDGTALTSNGWATSNGGVTYTQTGLYGTATLTTRSEERRVGKEGGARGTHALEEGDRVSDNFNIYVKDGSKG